MAPLRGWIYAMTNQSMPGLVKVGFTLKDPWQRAAELHDTGVPTPFEVALEMLVYDPEEVERRLHDRLVVHRHAKEFFSCDVRTVRDALDAVSKDLRLVPPVSPGTTSELSRAAPSPTQVCRKQRRAFSRLDEIEVLYWALALVDLPLGAEFCEEFQSEIRRDPTFLELDSLARKPVFMRLASSAESLAERFLEEKFDGSPSALRLYSELRYAGHWDLAALVRSAVRKQTANLVDALQSARADWNGREPISGLCAINRLVLTGGDVFLSWIRYDSTKKGRERAPCQALRVDLLQGGFAYPCWCYPMVSQDEFIGEAETEYMHKQHYPVNASNWVAYMSALLRWNPRRIGSVSVDNNLVDAARLAFSRLCGESEIATDPNRLAAACWPLAHVFTQAVSCSGPAIFRLMSDGQLEAIGWPGLGDYAGPISGLERAAARNRQQHVAEARRVSE